MSIFYATDSWIYSYRILKLHVERTLKKLCNVPQNTEILTPDLLFVPFHPLASRILKTRNYLKVHENFASKQTPQFELTNFSK